VLQSIIRNTDIVTPKKKSRASCTPKKLLTPKSSRLRMHSPGGPYAVRTTNFVHIASLQLTKANLMKTNFSLEKVSSVSSFIMNLDICCLRWVDTVTWISCNPHDEIETKKLKTTSGMSYLLDSVATFSVTLIYQLCAQFHIYIYYGGSCLLLLYAHCHQKRHACSKTLNKNSSS